MIKGRERSIAMLSITVQIVLSIFSFLLSIYLTSYFIALLPVSFKDYKIITVLLVPVWYLLLGYYHMGRMLRMERYTSILINYMVIVGIGTVVLMTLTFLLELYKLPSVLFAVFLMLNIFVLVLFKIIMYRCMKFFRRKGRNTRAIVIIADDESSYFIDNFLSVKDWGYRLHAIVTDSDIIKHHYGSEYLVLPGNLNISTIIDAKNIDEVMYCKVNLNQDEMMKLVKICAEVGVVFRVQSSLLSMVNMKSNVDYFSQMPFLTFMNTPRNYVALKIKYTIDVIAAFLILVLISPLMLLIATLIKWQDGGPIFFSQERVGLYGRTFSCLKFRTMTVNADAQKASLMEKNEQEGPVFKIKNDPRVTRIGNLLRKSSMDELPQFFNVLFGDMSIVGPRPPIPAEVKEYERWQRRRLSMKPGLTCIWQVSGRNNIPFEQWMKMDMQYIDTWSLKLDALLFLKTFKVVLTGDGQ